MNTKLTLRLDENLIKKAKKVASSKKVSLSKMVSDYFKSITAQQMKKEFKSPILAEVSGVLPQKTQKELENSYKKHIEEKYL